MDFRGFAIAFSDGACYIPDLTKKGVRLLPAAKKTTQERNLGGRPRDPTVDELKESIQEYIDKCEGIGRFPTESGMMIHLGLVGDKMQRYLAKPEYKNVWLWAQQVRIDWLENKMVTDPKCATGCMNALKQEKNGGYVDRTVTDNKPKSLNIKLDGVGGKGAAL